MGETDVFIVGGGPAGLAAAIAARQSGLEVTVADIAQPPIDKACGEGIMPNGVAALEALGVNIPSQDAARFTGIRLADSTVSVESRFPQHFGLGIRRTILHQLLIDRATETGVSMHWAAHVSGVGPHEVFVNGQLVRSRWMIGADGQNSRFRKWMGLKALRPARRRYGFRRHIQCEPWSEFVEVYWNKGCQLYVTPVNAKEICVALITSDPKTRFKDVAVLFPQLARRWGELPLLTREQGAISCSQRFPRVYRGNRALIGEASGSVDAITGEGLSMAFQQALALGEALKKNDLRIYQRAHQKIWRLPSIMAASMLGMDNHAWLRQRVLRVFSANPALFSRLLAIHSGMLAPVDFGMTEAFSLGWKLLVAY